MGRRSRCPGTACRLDCLMRRSYLFSHNAHIMKKIISILFVLLLPCIFAWAQDVPEVDPQERIKALEKTMLELQSNRPLLQWQDYLSIGILVSAVVGLIGFYFKQAVETSKEKEIVALKARLTEFEKQAGLSIKSAEEKIIQEIGTNETLFRRIVETADLESLLKQYKRIYFIGEIPDNVIRLLMKAKFPRKNLFPQGESDGEDFDLLFINNENGTLNLDEMLKEADDLPDNVFIFYYSTKQGAFFPTHKLPEAKRDRVNFATNPAQLYGNLLNTLKYQHEVLRS